MDNNTETRGTESNKGETKNKSQDQNETVRVAPKVQNGVISIDHFTYTNTNLSGHTGFIDKVRHTHWLK